MMNILNLICNVTESVAHEPKGQTFMSVLFQWKGAFMNLYGELIRKLRQDNNITQEELANILLITPEKMAQVEAGQELLTDSELTLCANVLDASSAALKKGEYRPRTVSAELEESLQKFQDFYKAAAKSEAAILDMLQEINPSERYRGRYLDEQTTTRTAGFAIYDELMADYVRDEKGEPLMYATAKEAFQAVKELEEKYEQEKTVSENVTDSVTPDVTDKIQTESEITPDLTDEPDIEQAAGLRM